MTVVLLLLVTASAATCIREQQHATRRYVQAALPGVGTLHLAIWQPRPVYLPRHVDPQSVATPRVILIWAQDGRTGRIVRRTRFQEPTWAAGVLGAVLVLNGVMIGGWLTHRWSAGSPTQGGAS